MDSQWKGLFEEVTFKAETSTVRTRQRKREKCSRQRNGVGEGLVSLSRSQCGWSRVRNGEDMRL